MRIFNRALAGCLLMAAFAGCSAPAQSGRGGFAPKTEFAAPSPGYVKVAEDAGVSLEVDPGTMDIRLKKGDAVWRSLSFSGEDPAVKDASFDSLFVLAGSTVSGTEFVLDSFAACISRGQYEVSVENGKLTGVFTVGDITPRIILPELIRADTLEKQILSKLPEEERSRFLRRYKRYSLEDTETKEERDSLLKEYPALKDGDLYIINATVSEREKKQLAGYAGKIGYTEAMLDAEYAQMSFKEKSADASAVVEVTLSLSLEGGDLIAEIPANGLRYDTDKFVLNRVEFLKNLAAAQAGGAKSIFLPDGCGAVIDLSKASFTSGKAARAVYGGEDRVDTVYGETAAAMPVFGFQKQDAALFAIIEDGDALAELTADYTGKNVSAYPAFIYQARYAESTIDGWQNITVNSYNPEPPDCALRVRYKLLPGDSDYVKMACVYRDYLDARGELPARASDELPLYIETLGSVNADGRMLFVPVNREVSLTTFAQDLEILHALNKAGVGGAVHMRLTGAVNGGLMNTVSNTARFSNAVGGKSALQKLKSYADKNSGKIFINAEFPRVYKNGWFDGFSPTGDSARSLNGKYANSDTLNLATNKTTGFGFAYRPSSALLPDMAKSFLKSVRAWDTGISAGSLGERLTENYAKGKIVNRQQAKAYYERTLGALAEGTDGGLMVSGANLYALPHAAHLLNLPVSHSGLGDYADAVPFLQIVIHGRVNYAVQALNMTEDWRRTLLRAIETGGGVHIVLAAQNVSLLRSTPFSYYLSVDRDYWLPVAVEAYQKALEAVGDVTGQVITGHRRIAENVYETVYEGGKRIAVNYGDAAAEVGGVSVGAMDFAVLRHAG